MSGRAARAALSITLIAAPAFASEGARRDDTRETGPARAWFEVGLPGGAAGLARAAGLDPATEPWRLLPDLTRRLHAPYGERTGARAAPQVLAFLRGGLPAAAASPAAPGELEHRLATRASLPAAPPGAVPGGDEGDVLVVPAGPAGVRPPEGAGAAGDRVPFPLSLEAWRRILSLDRRAGPSEVVTAVAADAAAARLYRALATFDEPTLAALAGEEDTLRRILRRHADAFSVFGPSFRVDAGRVAVPGGHAEAALWQALVGARVTRPAEFLLRLASADEGRLFLLYDTVDRLPPARRAFALSAAEGSAERRLDKVRALRVLLSLVEPWWDSARPPFRRPPADPLRVLETVRVSEAGELAAPDRTVLWEAAFADHVEASPEWRRRLASSPPADAAWLVERIAGVESNLGRGRLAMLAFAQRAFGGGAAEADPGELLTALRGFGRYRALALTLERMGIRDVGLHAAAARHAQRLDEAGSAPSVVEALAQFQGALALLERAVHSSTLSAEEAADRVRSLVAVPLGRDLHGDGIARWLEDELLPLLRTRLRLPATADAETVTLRALAGHAAGEIPLPLQWEGLPYHVDPAVAEYRRLLRVRERQGGERLHEALAAPPSGRSSRLASVLVDIAYAAALGPSEGAPAASEAVSRRHEFGFEDPAVPGGARAGWALPRELSGPGHRWHARGAILGLDVGFARLALHRLESEVPPAPLINAADRRAFAEGVVLMRARGLDDAGRDAIAEALRRGRRRLAEEASRPGGLARVLAELRVRDWRRGILPWVAAHDPGSLEQAFTLAEVFWLGRGSAMAASDGHWGTSRRAEEGCLCAGLQPPAPADALAGRASDGRLAAMSPDLHLRVAEFLAELGLPARLAPAVLALAVQDMVDDAEPAYVDDALGLARFARSLPRARMEDYVAALVGRGPLLPVADP